MFVTCSLVSREHHVDKKPVSFLTMSPPHHVRSGRKDCLYSQEEIALMSPYKASYIQETDREKRATIVRQEILPIMLTHWASAGALNVSDEGAIREKAKVFGFPMKFIYSKLLAGVLCLVAQ